MHSSLQGHKWRIKTEYGAPNEKTGGGCGKFDL